ncbi:flagellar hook-associated protein 3 [Mangrovimicrobium sediminis]|uniref:Flagellar hook-associated protein 3 n=1 Tax=Mangrovimicrobium sediminis TaxID=2562682 RepID=A0A4Z0M0K9_9GAMM|nr:flagellar hook-associated protein FlgL [Haliea sp. SAOS-164]TGD73142.1 flagellar hook-associated protein 3 [Haliea sp. SAOS-164]
MRISTVSIYEQAVSSLNRQQAAFMQAGEQIATGRRVVNPSDDPQAAAQAIGVSQSIGILEQYTESRVTARNSLSQEESVLASVSDALASAKSLIVQGVNGTLSDTDRYSIATELEGIFQTLLGQANAADGNGRFLFGGFQDDSAPFVDDGLGNITYNGDTNERSQRVDASRLMPVSDNGERVFSSIQPGAGYIAEAATTNAGTAVFKGPGIVDATDPLFGTAFTLDFVDVAGEINISINGGAPTPYVDGESISFGGLSLELNGTPVAGDSIQVAPADTMNTDIFVTLGKALDGLRQPLLSNVDRAGFENAMSTIMRELDNSLDNVLTVRASVGGRLNELDVIDGVSQNRHLSYKTNLSALIDLDYNEAVAEYSLRQVGLQAAQQAFVDINGMSLFDFLR